MSEEKKIFGTDGVRGRANYPPMTVETALALGRAAGKLFRKRNGKHKVVVGKDTRLSCYIFENALISGLCSMGVDTLMVGPFPTPGVAFITRAYRADAGIVISASHNDFYDNGIKFFSSEGFKLSDKWEKEMEALVEKNDFYDFLPKDNEIGRNKRVHDADGRYIEFAKATFPRRSSLKNLKVAVDCANGAGYKVAPLVLKELDAEVFVYSNEPNGLNINRECGSTYIPTIQKGVIETQSDVGIALDGDADRVIMVDENAQVVDGDIMMAICAKYMQSCGTLQNNRVVGTVMTNIGIERKLSQLGIELIRSKVGDRYVIQDMLEYESNLGGEQSGHVIFLDHNTTGDGLVCALQVMKIMIETNTKLSELASCFQKYPQSLKNIKVASKPPLEDLKNIRQLIRDFESSLGDKGRVIIRYSGTENVCRIMVEGPTHQMTNEISETLVDAINKEIGVKS